ncbi:MAG: GntR family transcriptional regulator [Anaerococcus sp.]|uniref:GntR family transcriptional regulator n=1 Tax=Anaerococcus sp. TaxID=1872515 RepID=UPI00262AFC6F|nr:GntR family transcriptional regulator [Anaerococcus sp.]MCI5971584.1 GntR family transcriptional regulator [Anaerococcus sp.]MDD6919495.1 GntR family transcriptional regulator [Peptoniphilaceae bacterium]MDY2927544.1 GntR family transcriptional regulator [Anaerococcus sp.]
MNIKIKYSSDDPIYLQIKKQIQDAILNDEVDKNKALPSIRFLAKELRVSVATTKRAYDELIKDGLIDSVPGKGNFVKDINPQFIREKYTLQIEEKLKEAIDLSKLIGFSRDELHDLLDLMEEEYE